MNDTQPPILKKEFRIKGSDKILSIIKAFSATEKFIFGILTCIAIVSAFYLAVALNDSFTVPIPAHGGKITEGIVGLPRSVNPVLAFTDVDKDLSTLIYSGLMKYKDGELVPDLAESYTVSDDGLVYTFILKDDLRFHDGVPLTTDDIEFTVQKVEDQIIKSPKRADWANVAVKKVNAKEIQFILKQPYSPFLSNTTLGILPKHIWNKVDPDQFIYSQYNIEPIGSGPYKLSSIKRDSGGIPEYYTLSSFSRYQEGEPFISEMDVYFYPNERSAIEALGNGIVQAVARISPAEAERIASTTSNISILHFPLPRIFGIFFNQNQAPIFAQSEVRQALDLAAPKQEIVDKVLYGYGIESDSPLPENISNPNNQENGNSQEENIDKAKQILEKAGWLAGSDGVLSKKDKKGVQTLEFSIATADSPDLKQAAEIVKSAWEKIGAKVNIKVFEYGDLSQNIIATRKYDALLFGEYIGKDIDLYAFWHSSQRNSPGLNVAMYVNSKADKLLEDARTISDDKERKDKYSQFEKIIQSDTPAVFLYSPEFIYAVSKNIKGVNISNITNPGDRFYTADKWYVMTEKVWKTFVK